MKMEKTKLAMRVKGVCIFIFCALVLSIVSEYFVPACACFKSVLLLFVGMALGASIMKRYILPTLD